MSLNGMAAVLESFNVGTHVEASDYTRGGYANVVREAALEADSGE